jgi:hypothetical protein
MMKEKTVRTSDQEMKIGWKQNNDKSRTTTTDEEMTLEFMSGNHVTRQPKDYEEIEY